MKPRQRVQNTFNRLKTDKLPKGELGDIDDILMEQLLALKGIEYSTDFEKRKSTYEILGFDLVDVGLGSPQKDRIGEDKNGNPIFTDVWNRKIIVPKDSGGAWETLESPTSTAQGMAEYIPPPAEVFSVEPIKLWKEQTDLFVFSCVPALFGPSMTLFGLENFLIWCLGNHKEVHAWLEKFCELNIKVAERQIAAGCDGIVFGDDMAYNQGTFVSPDILRKLFFPYMSKVIKFIKDQGVPVIWHSDGYIMDVLPDFIDMGIDGIQSMQPSAGMDISEVKKLYGDKLILMGNVDIDLLGRGSPEQVAQEVRRLIDNIAPGGGFILSSSNELGRETSPQNALAMYETAEAYERNL